MRLMRYLYLILSLALLSYPGHAQEKKHIVSGDFYLNSQYYIEDERIDATLLPGGEKVGLNSALSINYSWGGLSAGLRYEAYLPPMLGFERDLEGHGIGNAFLSYNYKKFEVTVGSFYEQFGSGMALRSYYEPQLGLDNSIFGIRAKYSSDALSFILLHGRNRRYFDRDAARVTGGDVTVTLESLIKSLEEKELGIDLGLSIVYTDEENLTGLDIPSTTTFTALRTDVRYKNFNFGIEYGFKTREPHSLNRFSDAIGQGLFVSGAYSVKGFGVNIYWKYIENMFFRSNRESFSNVTSNINYLPPNSNVNTYRLTTLYPYAVQGNGENGINVDVFFNLKKGTTLGGKYGTKVATDVSYITSLKSDEPSMNGVFENPKFLAFSDSLYYANWNVEITKRINTKLNTTFGWSYIVYNQDVIEGIPNSGFIKSLTFFSDLTLRLPKRRFLRGELQHLSSKQHLKNWAFALLEYGWSSQFSSYISDEWNYSNNLHYYAIGLNYKKNATSVGLSYGRERSGLICVGGVCRFVPASNGLRVQISTSF